MKNKGKNGVLMYFYVDIVLLERMGGRERVYPLSGTPFHADFNEFCFVSIALTFTEILVDCDHT